MTLNEFIFSNKPRLRFARHLAFWLIFSLHFVIQNLMIGGPGEGKTARTFLASFLHFLYFLPIYLLFTYLFIEILLTRLLFRQRYALFSLSFLLLLFINCIAVYYAGALYLHHTTGKPVSQIGFNANKYHIVVDGLFIPFMLFGITTGIKFSKKWFRQQRENERLARQKLATELQLLKTSIHPRFLFHSLHTVEKYVQRSSAESPALILQLSDLLSYILYENDKHWVKLEKELEIIHGYINLEEKSFENRLLLKIEFPQNSNDAFIMPCLLLTLVENSFEYFLETRQEGPVLSLTIRVNDAVLHFRMVFSKPADEAGLANSNFRNIRKQLESQYQGLHQLTILPEEDRVFIDLKLPLYSGDLINLKKDPIHHDVPELV